jgi:putative oxidoreductase
MSIVRRLARPMLAATFIETGLSDLRHPGPHADQVRPLVNLIAGPLRIPADPDLFLRVDGAVMVGAGTLLALGRMPRLAALALVAGAAPSTYAEIVQWREKDPEQRRARRHELITRLGLIGGALLAAVDTGGRPGLAWRGRHAAEHVQQAASGVAGGTVLAAQLAGRRAGRQARQAARQAARQTRLSGGTASKRARLAGRQAQERAEAARKETRRAVERTRQAAATRS